MEEGKMKEGRCRSHLRRIRLAMVIESALSLGESSTTECECSPVAVAFRTPSVPLRTPSASWNAARDEGGDEGGNRRGSANATATATY